MARGNEDEELELTNYVEEITQKLETGSSLAYETNESEGLCLVVLERLELVWTQLQQFQDANALHQHRLTSRVRDAVARFVDFLGLHSRKKLLMRLAACRSIAEGTRQFHEEIDEFVQLLGLTEATEWKAQWEEDCAAMREQVGDLVDNDYQDVGKGLTRDQLVEVLSNIKYEVERKRESSAPEHLERLERTLELVQTSEGVELPDLPGWFVPSYAVICSDAFDFGSFGEVLRGTWEGRRVVVKRMFDIDEEAMKAFASETQVWAMLEHENVIKLFGACHVSETLFFVCEDATGGNFWDYFRDETLESKKRGLWRLFFEAAQGLSYLHSEQVIHASIKCNNLLVGDDGMAKLCDFGSCFFDELTISRRLKGQSIPTRWMAPEYVLEQGPAANPTRKSDVYSLGMSIIEAKTGEVPWGYASEDDIIVALIEGEGYPRPDGIFTDREWELVQGMTEFDPEKRWSLNRAIEVLKELADEAAAADPGSRYFRPDRTNTARGEKLIRRIIDCDPESSWSRQQFSGELSRLVEEELMALAKAAAAAAAAAAEGDSSEPSSTADIEDRLKLIADHFQHHVPRLSKEDRSRFLRQIQQVVDWCILETEMQKQWEANFPEFTLCNSCNSHNPVDNFDCCECGEELLRIRRDNLDFRFTVSDMSSLKEAISTFERMQDAVIEELVMDRLRSGARPCPACAKYNPVDHRFCSECGSRLDQAESKGDDTSGLSVRLPLQSEIQWLKSILDCSRQEEAAREKAWEVPPKEEACSRCGELNLESEMFCRECGLDIEFRREIRL